MADEEPELSTRVQLARPSTDSVRRAVRLAHVSGALFGSTHQVRVGRYVLSRELGRGGGGSVFAAHDPQLHRDVAVKLIACPEPSQRARALSEARTLARLAHPHIVPMHDVGETSDHVFLVMELLTGPSLREFAGKQPPPRQLVDAYRQAALGLAAAHAEGLVHRDFKPDNALFGPDGRVQVVDFGLATAGGPDGTMAGTPGYMAPEQALGGAAIDQFALGVSLREAFGRRAVPRRLQGLLSRATAGDPKARFASMAALAQALGDDPRARWVRRGLLLAPVALAALGFAFGRGSDVSACEGGPVALAPAWSPERGSAIEAHLDALATPLASAMKPGVLLRLEALGGAWLTAHRDTCLAHRRRALSDDGLERANACLARTRAGLREVVMLLSGADDASLDGASAALAAVDSPARCAEPLSLSAEGRVPLGEAGRAVEQQHEVALVHTRAATPQAVRLATEAVAAARALGHRRLLARALLTQGHAELRGEVALAVEPLHEAWLLALAEGADELAVEAWARHAWARDRAAPSGVRVVPDGREVMAALAERAGERGAFARALLFNNLGSIAVTAGDFERARADFRVAVSLSEQVSGPTSAELVTAVSNLATLTRERPERARLFAVALDRLRELVGAEHAQTLDKQLIAVFDGEEGEVVRKELAQLCPRLGQLHPALVAQRERCAFELAWQSFARGDAGGVRAASALFVSRSEPMAAYLALVEGGDLKSALPGLRVAAAQPRGSEWYHHLYAADAELVLAAVAKGAGERLESLEAARRAEAHLTTALEVTGLPYGVLLRRLEWARTLAR